MPFFSFQKKPKEEIVIIFDIGSGSVGGAIVMFRKNACPMVLRSVRENLGHQEHFNSERFLRAMLNSLETVTLRIAKDPLFHQCRHKIKQAFCILASPWYSSEIKLLRFSQKTPFVVTTDLIRKVLAQEKTNPPNKNKKTVGKKKASTIEQNVVRVKLNGYVINDPYAKKARLIEIALFTSQASRDVLDRINITVTKILNSFEKMQFHSFALIAFTVIRDVFQEENDFLFMDITGEVTDIALVRDDVILELASFPFGKHTLLRDVARSLDISTEEALSRIKVVESEKSDKAAFLQMRKALLKPQIDWLTSFQNTLTYFMESGIPPRTVFIMSDPDIQNIFARFVRAEQFTQFGAAKRKFHVIALDERLISIHCDQTKKKPEDFFLFSEAFFLNKINSLDSMTL
jgi:cell division ATPase FtsA